MNCEDPNPSILPVPDQLIVPLFENVLLLSVLVPEPERTPVALPLIEKVPVPDRMPSVQLKLPVI